MKAVAAILACGILAGCATSASTTITEGKALADAWASLSAAAQIADAAAKSGVLTGANAAKVSTDLKEADAVLTTATTAYQANQADPSVAGDITTAAAVVVEILTLSEPAK